MNNEPGVFTSGLLFSKPAKDQTFFQKICSSPDLKNPPFKFKT